KMCLRNVSRTLKLSRSRSDPPCSMNLAPRITQYRCLSTTCSARSSKYGIQPISPSDNAIFKLGKRWNMLLKTQVSIAPDVRIAPQDRFAMNGESLEMLGTTD